MSVLYVLLPLMLGVVGAAVGTFVWAARRGQLDDLDTPPLRMLADDEPAGARPSTAPARQRNVVPMPHRSREEDSP
ncbi:MAG: cbb3-type cytochrome oxidase assembly protein CcoS [Kofleriaceae bacterium]|nr:cbb3-type cytochrome oxidase assembly protein CcoS [Myxococcales bacterium]MCB9565338.1 cbb3-type cytochrome oxidase assembly protein CcoS [Kofleriaceae bacterium]